MSELARRILIAMELRNCQTLEESENAIDDQLAEVREILDAAATTWQGGGLIRLHALRERLAVELRLLGSSQLISGDDGVA